MLAFEVRNPSGMTLGAVTLWLRDTGDGRFHDHPVPIPPLAPGQALQVPIVLQPAEDPTAWRGLMPTVQDAVNLKNYLERLDHAQQVLHDWTARYTNGSVRLEVVTHRTDQAHSMGHMHLACGARDAHCAINK